MREVVIVQNPLWVVASLQGDSSFIFYQQVLLDSFISWHTFDFFFEFWNLKLERFKVLS